MSLITEPQNPWGWQIAGKTFIWLLIWVILAFLVFALMSVLGSDFFTNWEWGFMALVFVIIACIVTIIGMWIFAWLLNLMFGSDYYDFSKMFGFSVLANGLLVLLFLPIYFMLSDTINSLLFVLAFHVMFGFFVSYVLIEFTINPSYSASSLIWGILGFGITLILYMILYTITKDEKAPTNMIYLHVLSPFVISYMIIPLSHGIRTQIYYALYSWGSNPLYVPQLADVTQTQEEVDEVTVDIW
jgi:hypothetical protein